MIEISSIVSDNINPDDELYQIIEPGWNKSQQEGVGPATNNIMWLWFHSSISKHFAQCTDAQTPQYHPFDDKSDNFTLPPIATAALLSKFGAWKE